MMPALVDIPGGITVEPPFDRLAVSDAVETLQAAEPVWVDAWILAVEEGPVGDLALLLNARRRGWA